MIEKYGYQDTLDLDTGGRAEQVRKAERKLIQSMHDYADDKFELRQNEALRLHFARERQGYKISWGKVLLGSAVGFVAVLVLLWLWLAL